MDRRQRKTREAIFQSFTALLTRKNFNRITVGEIIEGADIGRATFYAHFETKELLLKAFCEELFCHIFDTEQENHDHRHIFNCDGEGSVFVHLFRHLQKNDNNILSLLSGENNDLFFSYFRSGLWELIESHLPLFEDKRPTDIPDAFWKSHILSTFVSTLKWWLENGMADSPETITEYFFRVV